jgi:uncharacterized YkwD family protein
MNMQPKKGIKKTLMVGALALTLSIPVGASAASAASNEGTSQAQAKVYTYQYSINLNTFLQQYTQLKPINGGYSTIVWPTIDTNKPENTVPSKPAPSVQPSKPAIPVQPSKPAIPVQPSKPATPVQPSTPAQTTKPATGNSQTVSTSEFATQVLTLVNQERSKAGLNPLKMTNSTLNLVALDKAKDIYNNNYFDHNSPTYGSPFDMMKSYGISYSYAGENIAKGQTSPQAVMTAWMNSAGHRANILNANFTTIGIGYYNNVWVQAFIG